MATPATESQAAGSLNLVGGLEKLLTLGLNTYQTVETAKAAKDAARAQAASAPSNADVAAAKGAPDTKTLLMIGGGLIAFGLGIYFITK